MHIAVWCNVVVVEMQVVLKDLVSKDVYTVDVDRWLSRYEDDLDVCRELAVSKPGVQPLPSKGQRWYFAFKLRILSSTKHLCCKYSRELVIV